MLEDLILTSVNEALRQADEVANGTMSKNSRRRSRRNVLISEASDELLRRAYNKAYRKICFTSGNRKKVCTKTGFYVIGMEDKDVNDFNGRHNIGKKRR